MRLKDRLRLSWFLWMAGDILYRARSAFKEFRWRGPFRFSFLVLRELLSPLLYWHVLYVFEKVAVPQSGETTKFDIQVYKGQANFARLARELVPMGQISAEFIERRLNSGDAVAVAYSDGEPVGYAWMMFSSGLELAFGTAWIVGAQEAALHGSFTHPKWRGRYVQRDLDRALMRYAYQLGIDTVYSTISALNTSMLRGSNRIIQRKIMTLVLVRVRGLNWVYRKSFGAPLESRFAAVRQMMNGEWASSMRGHKGF